MKKKNLKPSFYADLDPGLTHILLFRHAERREITDFRTSTEALLTPRGEADALRLGRHLAGRFDHKTVYHSPVERCRQTAERLATGLNEKKDSVANGGPLSWLGGDFIRATVSFVDDYMNAYGGEAFMRHWFDGRLPQDRIAPLAEAAPIELAHLRDQLVAHTGLVIDVTHDWNMMLLLEHYFGLRFEEAGTPGFLECIGVSAAAPGRVRLRYRDRSIEIVF